MGKFPDPAQGKIIAGRGSFCKSKGSLVQNRSQLGIDRIGKIDIPVIKQCLNKARTIGHQCKAGMRFQRKICCRYLVCMMEPKIFQDPVPENPTAGRIDWNSQEPAGIPVDMRGSLPDFQ